MKPLHYLQLTAVLLVCSLASSVIAQPARENQERRPQSQNRTQNDEPRGERPSNPPQGGLPFERILNDEQREQFREAMQSNREKMREMGERQQKLRAEMQEALFADKLDEEGIRKRAADLAVIDAQRQIFMARAFQKVRPSLSTEQLAQMKKAREEMGRRREQRRGQFFEQRREQGEPRGGESIGPKPETGPDRPRNSEQPNRPRQEARLREEFRPERQSARPEVSPRDGMPQERRFNSPRSEQRGDFAPRPEGDNRGPRSENRDGGFNQPRPPAQPDFRHDSRPPRSEMRRREQPRHPEDVPKERRDLPPPSAPGRP